MLSYRMSQFYFISVITIIAPVQYPKAEANAILSLSLQVLDSTMYPTKGNPKKGPIKAKKIIPKEFASATFRI